MNFNVVVSKARQWSHGTRKHADAMQNLYNLFRVTNGFYASFNQLWDWVDKMELQQGGTT